MTRRFHASLRAALVLAVLTLGGWSAAAQTMGSPERYTATAVNMNRGRSSQVDIVVNRWSTDAERDKLMTVLNEQGASKLLDVLQKMPRVGYFRTPNSLGWDIHFAQKIKGEDGGERVVLLTDRRISFWEAANRPRSIDYPFTFIELRLNDEGEGEGKMSIATQIISDPVNNILTLENYDIQPVLLTTVKRESRSSR